MGQPLRLPSSSLPCAASRESENYLDLLLSPHAQIADQRQLYARPSYDVHLCAETPAYYRIDTLSVKFEEYRMMRSV